MKKIALFLFVLLSYFKGSTQLSGTAFLSGQTNHAGIKVKFVALSGTAATDSCLTNAAGNYTINISGGLYQVLFSNTGYQSQYYNNGASVILTNTVVLSSFTLSPGNSVYVSGNVSGLWGSVNTYYVQGDLTILAGTTLVIQPGTKVKFTGHYALNAIGTLIADGTGPASRILFTATDTTHGWTKIEVIGNSTSYLAYCQMEYSDEGVRLTNSSSPVFNCIMRRNGYAGILCDGGAPKIQNNEVYYYGVHGIAYSGADTGLVSCNHIHHGGLPNSFSQNSWGIRVTGGCKVINNNVHDGKVGLFSEGAPPSAPLFQNNYIHNNNSAADAGNSLNPGHSPVFVNNTFINNTTSGLNQAGYLTSLTFANNVVLGSATGFYCAAASFSCDHNLFYNCYSNFGTSNNFTVMGQIVSTNTNGDPIDSYYNLFQDPLFVAGQAPAVQPSSPLLNAGNSTYNVNIGVGSSVNCALSLPTGLKDNSLGSLMDLSVFPNPGTGHYYISLPVDAQVSVFDASGNVVLSQAGKAGTNLLNLTGYIPGLYIVKVADGRYYGTVKVVKE